MATLQSRHLPAGDGEEAARATYVLSAVRESYAWLVRLRWLAVLGVLAAAMAARIEHLVVSPVPVMVLALVLVLLNALWSVLARLRPAPDTRRLQRLLLLQLATDLVCLEALLHLAGHEGSALAILYVFHMALGAILLRGLQAWGLAAFAAVLHTAGELVAEPSLAGKGEIRVAMVAFWIAIPTTVYLVGTVSRRRWRAERESWRNARIAWARERMARIGELATGVAHTVRNPLHGALNCAELLADPALSPAERVEICELLKDALQRIERVTTRLLQLARHGPLSRVTCELGDIVQEALVFAEIRAQRRGVLLDPQVEPGATASVDLALMVEALVTLVDNAIDASERGQTVVVRGARGPEGAVLEVSDSGCGIPEELVAKVFDPFFTTKPVGEGTGVGLSVAERVLHRHGGRVEIENAAGQGTLVRFVLPEPPSEPVEASSRGLPRS